MSIARTFPPLLLAAILLGACDSNPERAAADDGSRFSLAVPVPDELDDAFCARFEVSAPDFTTRVFESDYPPGATLIEAVLGEIPAGDDRRVELGLFENADCGDLANAGWYGMADGISVRAGEVTIANLTLARGGSGQTGTIIVRGGRELIVRRLHGEVITRDTTPVADARCDVLEADEVVANVRSDARGVLNARLEVGLDTRVLALACVHDDFNPDDAVALLAGDPDTASTFTVTVILRPFLSPLRVNVNPALVAALGPLPAISAQGAPRPLAVIADERGHRAHFAEREMLLVTDDTAAVDAFIARWNGELLTTIDLAALNVAGLANQHLVRIDTSLADPATLRDNLLALDPNARGAHSVSSDSALALLSAAADAATQGLLVGLNWVPQGDAIASGFTREAANGPRGFTASGDYSRDAFDWLYMDSGSTQDIGVSAAWQLLGRLDRLGNRVRVAILDTGFAPVTNGDIASDFIAISNVPFVDPIGSRNPFDCSGGNPCPWHGTGVANAAMGLVDNDAGAAGPAGPVARPVLIFTFGDFITGISAVSSAYGAGARVINMSYGVGVPAIVSFTVLPFEAVTSALNLAGASFFASAGNDGNRNVDAEDCLIFDICWEETWHTPCENNGVTCVGGLATDSRMRHSSSSFGRSNGHVDTFAPFVLQVGPDPTTSAGRAVSKRGTSFSSPFAAGVAALVRAANPALSGREVDRILRRSAHNSPDPRVPRYVNALAAVQEAIGTAINIVRPADGASFSRGISVRFEAAEFSADRGAPTIVWRSSLATAPIGTGPAFSRIDLPIGRQRITVEASYGDGFRVSDGIDIEITNDPPRVFVDQPANGARFEFSEAIPLRGRSVDTNNPEGGFRLRDDQVRWTVNGIFAGQGHARDWPGARLPPGGPYVITFEGNDGLSIARTNVSVFIDPDPINRRPQVRILSPSNGANFSPNGSDERGFYYRVFVDWSAIDPEDGPLPFAATRWTTRINGGPPELLDVEVLTVTLPGVPSGLTLYAVRLYAPQAFGNTHDLRIEATDSGGRSNSATVRVVVNLLG